MVLECLTSLIFSRWVKSKVDFQTLCPDHDAVYLETKFQDKVIINISAAVFPDLFRVG